MGMTRSLRFRLSLWTTALVFVAICAYGTFVYGTMRFFLYAATRDSLRLSAEQISVTLEIEGGIVMGQGYAITEELIVEGGVATGVVTTLGARAGTPRPLEIVAKTVVVAGGTAAVRDRFRAALEGAVAVYGSATPRPESWATLERLELGGRLVGELPPVRIVDLRREAGYPL